MCPTVQRLFIQRFGINGIGKVPSKEHNGQSVDLVNIKIRMIFSEPHAPVFTHGQRSGERGGYAKSTNRDII